MKSIVLLSLITAFFSISCTTPSVDEARSTKLVLPAVEKLDLDKTNMVEASEIFGSPDMKVSLGHGQVAWLYLEGRIPMTRLSLVFSELTEKLLVVNWFVKEGDLESEIEKAKGRYPLARFTIIEPEWSNSHSGPDEILFSESKMNLEIVFQKTPKKVSAIRWESPVARENRKPSSKLKF